MPLANLATEVINELVLKLYGKLNLLFTIQYVGVSEKEEDMRATFFVSLEAINV